MTKEKIIPVLVGLLIVAAFLLGMMWTKVRYLEKAKNEDKKQVAAEPTPSGQPQGPQAKVEVPISANDPVKGDSKAKVTLVEFSDFECPFCGRSQETLKQIETTYKNQVKFVFKQFPLTMHKYAQGAALASLCAKEQGKFWEYHDKLFTNQTALTLDNLKKYAQDLGLSTSQFNSCLDSKKYQSQIDQDVKDGQQVGVQGTPAFFVNGRSIPGAQPFENFKAIIDDELKK